MKNLIIATIIVIVIVFLFGFSNRNNSSSQVKQSSTISNEEGINETSNIEEDEASGSLDFHGYDCTEDCSGHEAGYEWAEEHGITQDDVDNYSGNSNSFMEGMQAYVDDN